MAQRGAPYRQILGNPLAGILRDNDRAKRTVTGPLSGGTQGSWYGTATVDGGAATAMFPRAFGAAPAVAATAEGQPLVCYVDEVSATAVTVKAATLTGTPAPDGTIIHITANERS